MKKIMILISACLFIFFACESNLSDSGNSNSVLSGSYANMLTLDDFLYLITDRELIVYSIQDPANPKEVYKENLGFGIESMFIRGNLLFIGSSSTLYIYRTNLDGIPSQMSTTEYHNFINMCARDPVVADESTAYVTLSSVTSTNCFRSQINELRLYDIDDLSNPILINNLPMEEPKGLNLDGDLLFVCEANDGLKVVDVSDPLDLKVIHHFNGYRAFDVIPNDGHLLVVGPDSLYQYDYSERASMYLLSAMDL